MSIKTSRDIYYRQIFIVIILSLNSAYNLATRMSEEEKLLKSRYFNNRKYIYKLSIISKLSPYSFV